MARPGLNDALVSECRAIFISNYHDLNQKIRKREEFLNCIHFNHIYLKLNHTYTSVKNKIYLEL